MLTVAVLAPGTVPAPGDLRAHLLRPQRLHSTRALCSVGEANSLGIAEQAEVVEVATATLCLAYWALLTSGILGCAQ